MTVLTFHLFALQIIGNKSNKIFFICITMKELLSPHTMNHVLLDSFEVNPRTLEPPWSFCQTFLSKGIIYDSYKSRLTIVGNSDKVDRIIYEGLIGFFSFLITL